MNDDLHVRDDRVVRPAADPRASVGTGRKRLVLEGGLFDGEDVTDSGIEFAPGRAYEGLQIVFTQKTTDLSGLVTDDRGKPVLDATVVIFPANRDKWTFLSRYIRTLRPDTNGRYTVKPCRRRRTT